MSLLDTFAYELPPELIAHTPVSPRETARLFVYDCAHNEVTLSTVSDLPSFIKNAVCVVNDTSVVPARLKAIYQGEPIELLILVDQGITEEGYVRTLVNRRVKVGEHIITPQGVFEIIETHEKSMQVKFLEGKDKLLTMLESVGEMPFPPYIHSSASEAERRAHYQTMFAVGAASVAAPTSSLHFTPALVETLVAGGATFAPLTLQVGLGTFAPVFDEHIAARKLHEEHFYIPKATAQVVRAASEAGRPVLAVGTTVVRTLEAGRELVKNGEGGVGSTDMFILPPHEFTYPDMLMTNFHVPRSSLLCLVQAFLEYKGAPRHIINLYGEAIEARFRFYSFGDAMLIL